MKLPEWYNVPLDMEDVSAGGGLLILGIVSITIYAIVMYIMWKQDKEIVGYRFLISAGFTDILLLVHYGVWPGLTILCKSEIILPGMRHWVQLYLDWAWFSMVWHYAIVGWSRWFAIRAPHNFRSQKRSTSYTICAACYVVALVQVLATHFQPWYVTFYYEPSSYGMLAEDFDLYFSGGQVAMFFAYHAAAIVPPIIFYSWAFLLLLRRKRSGVFTRIAATPAYTNVESRLLLPCVINMAMFIVGQVVITVGTGEGKWAGFTVMLLFCANSALNPLLLLVCSKSIRKQLLHIIGLRRASLTDTLYKNPMMSIGTRSERDLRNHLVSHLADSPQSSREPSTHL